MQFNYVDHEGYRRVDKRKAKRLFNLGYTIHLRHQHTSQNYK